MKAAPGLNRRIRNLFYSTLIEKKIFLAPYHHGYLMNSHSKKDIKNLSNAVEYSLNLVNRVF